MFETIFLPVIMAVFLTLAAWFVTVIETETLISMEIIKSMKKEKPFIIQPFKAEKNEK